MWAIAKAFFGKYIFEIIAVVAFAAAAGWIWYGVTHWCNAACREAQSQATKAKEKLVQCQTQLEADRKFYDTQRAAWQAQVDAQQAAIDAAKKEKAEIVDTQRKKFDTIFKRNAQNEQESKKRAVVQIRPTDVVTAPLALVREYNEAVARSYVATGNSGTEVWIPDNSRSLEGQIGTFDAMAAREALVENANKYVQLAIRCDALVGVVEELEKKYGTHPNGADGKVGVSGGDVSDGIARAAFQ